MHNLISISDLSKEQILQILRKATEFKNGLVKNSLAGRVIASCFFEASTRTRLSFESAIARLDGKVIGFADSGSTSLANKGESLVDTLKIINGYADALVLRHPLDGAARLASEICGIPVINAGDGANQHPTQTLLDLFSILDSQGHLEDINLGIMGDLKYSRTVHSLVVAAKLFKMRLYFIAPKELQMHSEHLFALKQAGIHYSFHGGVEEVISQLNCLYVTRLQKERFDDGLSFNDYRVSISAVAKASPKFKILSPLPRQDELPIEIDATPYAYYFQQAANGVYVRQALLDILFTK